MNTFRLKIITTDRIFFDGECEVFTFPVADGSRAVMANHAPMTAGIEVGVCNYRLPDGTEEQIIMSDGLLKVENNEVDVLCYYAERPEEVDIHRAERALEEAKEQLQQKQSRIEYNMSSAQMARAMARLSGAKGVLSERFTETPGRK